VPGHKGPLIENGLFHYKINDLIWDINRIKKKCSGTHSSSHSMNNPRATLVAATVFHKKNYKKEIK
jgi:hypothetical protein